MGFVKIFRKSDERPTAFCQKLALWGIVGQIALRF